MTAPPHDAAAKLALDPARETDRIAGALRQQVLQVLGRKGVVIGLSGGVDSSVCAALAVRAFGSDRVLGLLMPERESSDDSLRLGRLVAGTFGIGVEVEQLGPVLDALGCYRRRDEAIRTIVPEYGAGWRSKLVLASARSELAVSSLVVESPSGEQRKVRITAAAYRQIVAATNFKQRVRKVAEYYHADRLQYAVAGTANRLEYDQGFFVKLGDGSADVKPIAHLYKTQVYQLGAYLGVPAEILRRPPTTDTFSLPQSQEEFYFSVPLETLDVCLHGKNSGLAAADIAEALGTNVEEIERVYADIDRKRRATRYLHAHPLTVDTIEEIQHLDGRSVHRATGEIIRT